MGESIDAILDETGAQVLALVVGLLLSGLLAVGRWWLFRRSPANCQLTTTTRTS